MFDLIRGHKLVVAVSVFAVARLIDAEVEVWYRYLGVKDRAERRRLVRENRRAVYREVLARLRSPDRVDWRIAS